MCITESAAQPPCGPSHVNTRLAPAPDATPPEDSKRCVPRQQAIRPASFLRDRKHGRVCLQLQTPATGGRARRNTERFCRQLRSGSRLQLGCQEQSYRKRVDCRFGGGEFRRENLCTPKFLDGVVHKHHCFMLLFMMMRRIVISSLVG